MYFLLLSTLLNNIIITKYKIYYNARHKYFITSQISIKKEKNNVLYYTINNSYYCVHLIFGELTVGKLTLDEIIVSEIF